MNKLNTYMTNALLKEYAEKYFDELTIADFELLSEKNIIISPKVINNKLDLLEKKEIIIYIFKNYENIPSNIALEIIRRDISITFEDVRKYPSVRNNEFLYSYALEKDPRIILLCPASLLNFYEARKALNSGIIPTEEDIINNPDLRDFAPIMEVAIKHDPKLIRLITSYCGIQLSNETIVEALSNYKLTEEDLINNPELTGVYSIISKYPEFHFYSEFLTDEEKIEEIKRLLTERDFATLSELPFLKKEFHGKASEENIKWLAEFITKEIKEDDVFEQRRFQKILDNIIDGIVTNNYNSNKHTFLYPDLGLLAKELKNVFYEAKENNSEKPLKDFADSLINFINKECSEKRIVNYDYIINRIYGIYANFLLDESSLFGNDVTIFFNEVLNYHRNGYCSNEKNKIINKLKCCLPLSEKKLLSIYNGKKLMKISYLLGCQKYVLLDTTRDEIKLHLSKVEEELKNNKDLAKLYGEISLEAFKYFKVLFLNSGQVDYVTISHMLSTKDRDVVQYIFKKYEQIKLELLDYVYLSDIERIINDEQKVKLGLNVINFTIASNDLYLRNIATLLLNVTDEDIMSIKENAQYISNILDILPFANILPQLDTEMVIKILNNYGKIKERIICSNKGINNDNAVLTKFGDIMNLAEGYATRSNLHEAVFGNEILEKLGITVIQDYLDFYHEMRNKLYCSIPKVSGEYDGKVYESGNFIDMERLLLGKLNDISCIDLNNLAGRDTFIECLSGIDGDVIMIRDKETRKFFARCLVFRRGNIVQIACAYDQYNRIAKFSDEFFTEIANQIINQAVAVEDNIDYVFLTKYALNKTNFTLYHNKGFEKEFPHADFRDDAYLIGVNPKVIDKEINENIDFAVQSKCVYPKIRKEVVYNAEDTDLTRLKAMSILAIDNEVERKELEKSFEPFYKYEYIQTISGEDWYIALRKDGEMEEVVLNSEDPRTMEEFTNARENIRALQSNMSLSL